MSLAGLQFVSGIVSREWCCRVDVIVVSADKKCASVCGFGHLQPVQMRSHEDATPDTMHLIQKKTMELVFPVLCNPVLSRACRIVTTATFAIASKTNGCGNPNAGGRCHRSTQPACPDSVTQDPSDHHHGVSRFDNTLVVSNTPRKHMTACIRQRQNDAHHAAAE